MSPTTDIRTMTILTEPEVSDLVAILDDVISAGASVGWISPPPESEARAYWNQVIQPNLRLVCAFAGERIIATGQIEFASKENGSHRAEIAKVLVRSDYQGEGLGRKIMIALEEIAVAHGRTLLHLDTDTDARSNEFYRRLGWTEAGTIPNWAKSAADGQLHGTTFYYKDLST
ncbi:MAG TPA: GNAT family N-acetyltransferase [Thermomicrobiales bacterium]|nr:GNAT family N-acetyltransferase [Thermomicrobiales bacterium]